MTELTEAFNLYGATIVQVRYTYSISLAPAPGEFLINELCSHAKDFLVC